MWMSNSLIVCSSYAMGKFNKAAKYTLYGVKVVAVSI
jgi:hypothetical protein